MNQNFSVASRAPTSALTTNKLIRNTYTLLSMTLLFSSAMAVVGVMMNVSQGLALGSTIAAIAMLWFVLPRTANSAMGIPVIFGITGLLGLGLGPVLNFYLSVNPSIVMTAMGGTGAIFLGLSAYALTTRKDFSFLAGFLMVGMFVVIGAMLANLFLNIPAMALALDVGIIMIMSGFILFQTSTLVNGGETNYIMATASLFLSILNLFQALLHLLGAFSGDD